MPSSTPPKTVPLVGPVTRAQIEAAVPAWLAAEAEAAPEASAVASLRQVAPGADVTVYLGTWCGDSRREVTRLWRALDQMAQIAQTDKLGAAPPFSIRYIGVGRDKKAPGLPPDLNLRRVPTFVVTRAGSEVGRIVESAPTGIESDLQALLSGTKSGTLSERTDL